MGGQGDGLLVAKTRFTRCHRLFDNEHIAAKRAPQTAWLETFLKHHHRSYSTRRSLARSSTRQRGSSEPIHVVNFSLVGGLSVQNNRSPTIVVVHIHEAAVWQMALR
jgi:hypothetical protein